MDSDLAGLDRAELISLLNAEYGLDVTALHFQPKGADSFCYLAACADGALGFVKLYPGFRFANTAELERALRLTQFLRAEAGLEFVVSPRPTRQDRALCSFGPHAVAVFDFVEGATAHEQPLAADEQAQVARALAALHQSAGHPGLPAPERAMFTLPFKPLLLRVLKAAEDPALAQTDDQRRLRDLLNRERADVLAMVERMEGLGRALSQRTEPVLTHGEPTAGNVLRTPAGELRLLDWGELALGPAERDLNYFAGERLKPFLAKYSDARARPPQLRAEAFGFYFYRWTLSEIADYSARIFWHTSNSKELAWAWDELPDYLPIPHRGIADGMRDVQAILEDL
jgi:aminoglycoside phosphotransferase (APT) family kinase protein